jgi:hypothetical protein
VDRLIFGAGQTHAEAGATQLPIRVFVGARSDPDRIARLDGGWLSQGRCQVSRTLAAAIAIGLALQRGEELGTAAGESQRTPRQDDGHNRLESKHECAKISCCKSAGQSGLAKG